jgi:hypothetical protein
LKQPPPWWSHPSAWLDLGVDLYMFALFIATLWCLVRLYVWP